MDTDTEYNFEAFTFGRLPSKPAATAAAEPSPSKQDGSSLKPDQTSMMEVDSDSAQHETTR